MSDIRGVAAAVPTRVTSDGVFLSPQLTRDGAVVTADYLLARALEGKMFTANVGSASTPTSFAKTAYDADQPQLVIDVPDNYLVIPTNIALSLEDSAGTDTEIMALHSSVNVGAGTSTAVTPVNNLTGGGASNASVYSLYTGNGTDPTTGTEQWFFHDGYAFADATTDPKKRFEWSYKDNPIAVRGTGSIVIYITGTTTAPAGYLTVSWIELPETMVS